VVHQGLDVISQNAALVSWYSLQPVLTDESMFSFKNNLKILQADNA